MTVVRKINLNHKKARPVIWMKEAEFKRIVRKQPVGLLRQKFHLIDVILGFIALNPDPRGLQAIKHYQKQQRWLREVIEEKQQPPQPPPKPILRPGESEGPPPQVITLDTLSIKSDLTKLYE